MKKFITGIFVSIVMFTAASANATTENYGTLLAGTYQPSASFASLSATGSGNVYTFTLTGLNLDSLFTNGAFIGSIAVDTNPDLKLTGKNHDTVSISSVTGGATVGTGNGKGPGGNWDFQFDLGNSGVSRLTSGESVSWTATFSKPVTFADVGFALHVQGLTPAEGGSAWYVAGSPITAAVPEPSTYLMLLAGLGIIGFVSKRRLS
ncbi:MAG: PEP-CTERM sorting domain-containing protein [Methylophilaceae bacterium]|nr:PEP-CTERM sorting domain-containing protein [Methyloradius sp.]